MRTVADVVGEILSEDGLITETLQRRVLNISAYANSIHPEVESRTGRPVRIGTVIVALSRLAAKITATPPLSPYVKIDRMDITSSLHGISYDKTDGVLADVSQLNHSYFDNANAFLTMTVGAQEVTIICSDSVSERVAQSISQNPKAHLSSLVAISVQFSEQYLTMPNTIYALVGALASRRVTVIRLISTYTELTFVVYEQEMELAIQALQTYQKATTTPTTTTSSGG